MKPSSQIKDFRPAANSLKMVSGAGRAVSSPSGKFWMVHRIGGSSSIGHLTKESASCEAQRLATKHPGNIFYILESVGLKFVRHVVQRQNTTSKSESAETFGLVERLGSIPGNGSLLKMRARISRRKIGSESSSGQCQNKMVSQRCPGRNSGKAAVKSRSGDDGQRVQTGSLSKSGQTHRIRLT